MSIFISESQPNTMILITGKSQMIKYNFSLGIIKRHLMDLLKKTLHTSFWS